MTRRDLIRSATAALAATRTASLCASAPPLRAGMQTNAWKIGTDDFSSFLSVLEHIAKLGFDGFETSYRNVQPVFGRLKEAKAQIAATGLRFLGCHVFLSNYDGKTNIAPAELIEQVADGAAGLGAERLILSGAPLEEDGKIDNQRLLWKAGALNRAGRHSYDLKLRVCYHNHGPEFANGSAEILALVKETDPDNVHFVIDAGHAMRVKADAAGFFAKYHKRIDGLHLRDFDSNNVQVPLGRGTFQYDSLATAVRKAKWNGWVIAEEERESGEKPGDEAAAPAREQIRKLFGV